MRRAIMVGFAFALSAMSCKSFLDDPQATRDPNNPSTATRNQLLAGIEANTMSEQESGVAMIVCQWMQQCAGTAGRFVEVQGHYIVSPSTFDLDFSGIYAGGGLVSIRAAEASASADGDSKYLGVLEVLEALDMSWAADMWGDVPYSDAVSGNPTPKFDPQMGIYDALQSLLDKAITDLGGAGTGPLAADYLYNGNITKWTQLANTLKARLYLHTVEKLGNGQYTKAIAAAQKGISSQANSLLSVHSTATSERNIWAQFQLTSFGNDLVAGKVLVDMMKADNDPRLAEYFGKDANGNYTGFDARTNSPDVVSPIAGSGRTNNVVFPQPLVTWEENQLILAEANFVLSGAAAAQPYLDAVRASVGKPSKPATLQSIMEEKYVALFMSIEVWNDWKRTCLPRLHPAIGQPSIPGRIFYGSTEEQTNPNTPSAATQLATNGFRNPNDPAGCPP